VADLLKDLARHRQDTKPAVSQVDLK